MKVFLSCPTYDRAEWHTVASIFTTLVTLQIKGYVFHFDYGKAAGDPLLSRARSDEIGRFLRSNSDVLLTVDSDMVVDPGTIEKLLTADLPVVGIPCGRNVVLLRNQQHNKVAEVKCIGAGVMAVKREVIEAMCTPDRKYKTFLGEESWALYLPRIGSLIKDQIYITEDFSFCLRAREAGFKVYGDFSLSVKHIQKRAMI